MTVQPNGTDAKDVALHFIRVTVGRATPAIIGKTVVQAKTLLQSGYTKDEIIDVINVVVDKGIAMYSLGYISACINDVLKELQEQQQLEEQKNKSIEIKKEIESQQQKQNEVIDDGESTKRNRDKLNRFGNDKSKKYTDFFNKE